MQHSTDFELHDKSNRLDIRVCLILISCPQRSLSVFLLHSSSRQMCGLTLHTYANMAFAPDRHPFAFLISSTYINITRRMCSAEVLWESLVLLMAYSVQTSDRPSSG